jgi:hypothetical protein
MQETAERAPERRLRGDQQFGDFGEWLWEITWQERFIQW